MQINVAAQYDCTCLVRACWYDDTTASSLRAEVNALLQSSRAQLRRIALGTVVCDNIVASRGGYTAAIQQHTKQECPHRFVALMK